MKNQDFESWVFNEKEWGDNFIIMSPLKGDVDFVIKNLKDDINRNGGHLSTTVYIYDEWYDKKIRYWIHTFINCDEECKVIVTFYKYEGVNSLVEEQDVPTGIFMDYQNSALNDAMEHIKCILNERDKKMAIK